MDLIVVKAEMKLIMGTDTRTPYFDTLATLLFIK